MNKFTASSGVILLGEASKKISNFTVDFVGHRKQFLSRQYPNIGLIKLGGGRGGLDQVLVLPCQVLTRV